MGILDVPGYSRAQADARFQPNSLFKRRAATVRAAVGALRDPIPPVTADAPTIAHNTATNSASYAQLSAQSAQIAKLGDAGVWSVAFGRLDVKGVHAVEFDYIGSVFELQWQVGQGSTPFWVWVDGAPITATPSTIASANGYYSLFTFGSAKRRRITIYAAGNNAWRALRFPVTGVVSTPPPRIKVGFVGDSFYAGSDATYTPVMLTMANIAGRMLGANFSVQGVGGSGYVAGADTFGGTDRVARVAATNPDLIIISGSVNDDATGGASADAPSIAARATAVQAAATAAYAAYASSCPGVPIIVFGPQPTDHTQTISANRAAQNAAVRAAALAAPNVIGYVDMIGTANGTAPPAWTSGGSYAEGALVTYKGSVWRYTNNGTAGNYGAPDSAQGLRWQLVTWVYTGTGRVGSTTGDGTRDVMLYSDTIHPTTEASYSLGVRQASEILAVLDAYLLT
ncbi:GDSL-type esterase/lipase family protein [Microbacterium kunmingense]|uniref:GDSL-type esterase/lipase family protein n=1 Tax=Microbacterium kunmingense TaxID=2915939 RepID=UPI003D72CC11